MDFLKMLAGGALAPMMEQQIAKNPQMLGLGAPVAAQAFDKSGGALGGGVGMLINENPRTQAMVKALMGETPESVIQQKFGNVDPMSAEADAIRERAMQQYMANSPFAPRGR